jgi:hypothetical protein
MVSSSDAVNSLAYDSSKNNGLQSSLALPTLKRVRSPSLIIPSRGNPRRNRKAGNRLRRRPLPLSRFWPNPGLRKRWWRAFRRTSTPVQAVTAVLILLVLSVAANWIYQVIRKPTELFFPVSGALNKTPTETWRRYAPFFKAYSTGIMTPELLAAIAQVEGAGNPVARTYWRWTWTRQPFEMYRPASSSVGMYQMTDGTFAEARRLCIRDHAVVDDGPWNNWHSCWFNGLYTRVAPGDSVELTSAYLDRSVASILERHRLAAVPLARKQELATIIHLCGAGAGDEYARRGLRLAAGQRCGDHEAHVYLTRVNTMKEEFGRLAANATMLASNR